MGRHSASDDDEDVREEPTVAWAAPVATIPSGRHAAGPVGNDGVVAGDLVSLGDIEATGPVVGLSALFDAGVGGPDPARAGEIGDRAVGYAGAEAGYAGADAEPGTAPAEPAAAAAPTEDAAAAGPTAAKPGSGTRADLRLLRTHPALRAQCAAAVVAPFALFIVVLLVIGRLDVFVYWVWIPIVTAGVAVGLCLDAGHKRWT